MRVLDITIGVSLALMLADMYNPHWIVSIIWFSYMAIKLTVDILEQK